MTAPSTVNYRDYLNAYSSRIPKAVGMIAYSVAGIVVAKKCVLIASGCANDASKLALIALKEKALESANKQVLIAYLSFSLCRPQYYNFAAMGIAAAACTSLAYRYAREFFKPLPPTTPSPRH